MIATVVAVLKEPDWTSHDAVDRFRSCLGVREIGHAGSLDPFATGVLVCGIGRGTKVLSYLMDLPKEYVGVIRLGITTDSGDATGEIKVTRPVAGIAIDRLRILAQQFIGRQEQVPPMVSAVHHQGKRLYELARAGVEVERKPRVVEIHEFEIHSVDDDRVRFRLLCGRGTYVRTLAQDFGERIGTGGCVETLHRSKVGPFGDDRAVSLTETPERVREAVQERGLALSAALGHLPSLRLKSDWVRRVRHGERPPWRAVDAVELPSPGPLRLLGPEGELVAIAGLEPLPGPIDRPWQSCWEIKLDRVL